MGIKLNKFVSQIGVFESPTPGKYSNEKWSYYSNTEALDISYPAEKGLPKGMKVLDETEPSVAELAIRVRKELSSAGLPWTGNRLMANSEDRTAVLSSLKSSCIEPHDICSLSDIVFSACIVISHEAFSSTSLMRSSNGDDSSIKKDRAMRYLSAADTVSRNPIELISNRSIIAMDKISDFILPTVAYFDGNGVNLSAIINSVYNVAAKDEIESIKEWRHFIPDRRTAENELSSKGEKCNRKAKPIKRQLFPHGIFQ